MKQLMNVAMFGVAATTSLGMFVACSTSSSGETSRPNAELPARTPTETARVESAITSTCRLSTVGLPCDPDGDGAATECEGLCWADDSALVSCRPVAELNLTTIDLNGRICGDADGRNCGQSCENGQCVDKNARLGTACRPTNGSSTCEGVCTLADGEPTCDEFTVCGDVGISDNGCVLTACNFDSFEVGCRVFELENPVCEASNPPVVTDAGPATDSDVTTGDTATSVVPDAAVSSTNDVSTASDGEPDAAVSSETSSTSSSASSRDVPEDGGRTDAVDAGRIDGDGGRPVVVNRAVKVVGGACSMTRGSGAGSLSWLAIAALAVFGRRRR